MKLEGDLEQGSQRKNHKGSTSPVEWKMKTNDKEWDDDSWGGWVTAALQEDEHPTRWRLNFSKTEY